MNALLTALAAAIAKGVVQGYLEALEQRSTAIEEIPDEKDRAAARRIHDAIIGLPVPAPRAGLTGSPGATQGFPLNDAAHMGSTPGRPLG